MIVIALNIETITPIARVRAKPLTILVPKQYRIAQVMIVGEGRRFPSALIVPAFDKLKSWCKIKGIKWQSNDEIIENKQVIDKYQREVDLMNKGFGHWEQIKKFVLLPKEWSIDAGELTPKLSLRRKVILSNHAEELDEIYKEERK